MNAALAVFGRELRRTVRQPAHLGATLLTPIVVWAMFAGGLAGAFDGAGRAAEALVPGMTLLVVVFGSLYAAMTLADERERLWVQTAVLEGVPASMVAIGKLAAGAVACTAQAMAVLVLTSAAAGGVPWAALPGAALVVAIAAFGTGGVASALACVARTPRAFHGLINLVLMPAWLLSGSVFPLDRAAAWVRSVGAVNPVSWAHASLSAALPGGGSGPELWTAATGWNAGFAAVGVCLAAIAVARFLGPSRSCAR